MFILLDPINPDVTLEPVLLFLRPTSAPFYDDTDAEQDFEFTWSSRSAVRVPKVILLVGLNILGFRVVFIWPSCLFLYLSNFFISFSDEKNNTLL